MKKKFTQGEWYVDQVSTEGQDYQGRILCKSKERKDCNGNPQVYIIVGNHEKKLGSGNIHFSPNAKLIAAAPELLEALESLVYTASKLWDEVKIIKDSQILIVTHPTIENAKAAIKKATE